MERQSRPNWRTSRDVSDRAGRQHDSSLPRKEPLFKGFPEFRSNVLYCPKQFFTAVIPHSSVNCIRLVSYMLRKTLGWVDETGEPIQERHEFSFRELEESAGVGHSRLGEALELALNSKFITCVQKARIQSQGVRARSAAYELCWDESRYTDKLDEFRGFYIAPTYLDSAGQTRLARKNIPNVFFDYLVCNESRGVIRVVGTLLWYSIDWGKGGERRKPVKKSLRDLVELTQLDKSNVVRALDEATEKAYIERVQPGVFDRTGKKLGSVTVYGINWTSEYTYTYDGLPLEAAETTERSQNATRLELVNAPKTQHGEPARTLPKCDTTEGGTRSQNATRNAPKTQHAERSQNATIGITKTTIPNTSISTAAAPSSETNAVVDQTIAKELLQTAGFSQAVADTLSLKFPLEVIKNQIGLLPQRAAARNPLGLLRRAIEENWPAPEDQTLPTSVVLTPAAEFAASFYAGYHQNPSSPVSEPSPADVLAADKFLSRLLELSSDPAQAPTWGREFGALVAYRHKKNERAFPSLKVAVQQYGDEFYSNLKGFLDGQRKRKREEAQQAHYVKFEAAWEDYSRSEIDRHFAEGTNTLREFEKEREAERKRFAKNQFGLDMSSMLKQFDSEETKREQFKSFLLERREERFFDFWDWDHNVNPERFQQGDVSL